MVKVLFICHGNICRSPMAEYLLKEMVRQQGLAAQFQIASAATSREEIGNDVYPPARAELRAHGIPVGHRAAVQVTPRDYDAYDWLLTMDEKHEIIKEVIKMTKGRIPCFFNASGDMIFSHMGELMTEEEATKFIADNDIIFSETYDPRPNHFRNIRKGSSPVIQKIAQFFKNDKV